MVKTSLIIVVSEFKHYRTRNTSVGSVDVYLMMHVQRLFNFYLSRLDYDGVLTLHITEHNQTTTSVD